jgi:hypothetical protein
VRAHAPTQFLIFSYIVQFFTINALGKFKFVPPLTFSVYKCAPSRFFVLALPLPPRVDRRSTTAGRRATTGGRGSWRQP